MQEVITRNSLGATIALANAASTDGWTSSSDTWSYASSTSFTISGVDRTATYTPGTKLKFTNNGSTQYGYVKSSSFSTNTTVNLVANTDYSLSNSSITNPYYSYEENPQGFPEYFDLSTTGITGFSAGSITAYVYKMAIHGKMVHLLLDISGGSNATTFTIPAPINAGVYDQMAMPIAVSDQSTFQTAPGVIGFSTTDNTTIYVGKTMNTVQGNGFGGFTASSGKSIEGQYFYMIQ